MATAVLVDRDLEIGRRILAALAMAGIPVSVAFWAHVLQIGEWQLFIATPLVDTKGHKAAYDQILRTLQRAGINDDLPWRRTILRSPKDKVFKSLEEQTSYSGSIEIIESENIPRGTPSSYYVTYASYPGGTLRALNLSVGDRFVEDAYVYGHTWVVTGLDHLREFLSKLQVNSQLVASALRELPTKKTAFILNVRLRPQDLKRLRPA
jgi:hypothetical protein